MKISCNIIKDLLPLYHDEVCSKDSRLLIEDHIKGCDDCNSELLSMNTELSFDNIKQNLNDAQEVNNISKHWKKSLRKSLMEGFVIALTICIIAVILYCFIGIKIG